MSSIAAASNCDDRRKYEGAWTPDGLANPTAISVSDSGSGSGQTATNVFTYPSGRPGVPNSVDKLEGPAVPDEEVAIGSTSRRRLPIDAAPVQADRVLTPEQKRELTIDVMASWALEGMQPTR